jgi:hypothetical protein
VVDPDLREIGNPVSNQLVSLASREKSSDILAGVIAESVFPIN